MSTIRLIPWLWLAGLVVMLGQMPVSSNTIEAELGPFGPQGPRMREQLWILPSGTPGQVQRATVFRPLDEGVKVGPSSGPRPLVIINHGTSETTRHSTSMPVYYWLSRWFVERGFVVVLPQRRGHGATGGDLAEGADSCSDPDHYRAGRAAADDVEAAVEFMQRQPFIARSSTIVAGISTGGWASLALAERNPANVKGILNFAGGRGGHAFGEPSRICGADRLVQAVQKFASSSAVPTLWLYSVNDTFFGPELAARMASAWSGAGGKAELQLLPAYGSDGHLIADDLAGWQLWARHVDRFISSVLHPSVAPSEKVPQFESLRVRM